MKLIAKQAVIDGQLKQDVCVEVSDGIIRQIGSATIGDTYIKGVLLPGFVDIHCHGGGGEYFSAKSPKGIEKAIRTHANSGTTALLASLVTAPVENLLFQIQNLVPFINKSQLRGIHLEGPYLAHSHCGAHDPLLLKPPTIEELKQLIDASGNNIKMVTIAPELEGAIKVIEFLKQVGVVVALGHSGADAVTTRNAIEAGATVITHFNNGMPKLNTGQNINSVSLSDKRVDLELILDGHHLSQTETVAILDSAPNRILAVTDAMSAAGLSDGSYFIGELAVKVSDMVARLESNGALAGSTLTMDKAFLNLIDEYKFSIPQAVFACSTLPADKVGLTDSGSISVGKRAEFVELTLEGSLRAFN